MAYDPASDPRYYRRHTPRQEPQTRAEPNPFPLPDDVRAIHAKKRGRRYMYRTGEVLVRADQADAVEQDPRNAFWRVRRADPYVPVGDSPQEIKAHERALAAQASRERSSLVLLRLDDAELRTARNDVPSLVRDIRSRSLEVFPNHILGVQQDGEYGPATAPVEIPPLSDLDPPGTAGADLTIAVIDTGIRPDHTLLVGHCGLRDGVVDLEVLDEDGVGGQDFVAGHGTFVAGVIRQHAPGATVLARGTVRANGTVSDDEVAGAVDDLADLKETRIDILNLSLGGYTHGDDLDGETRRVGAGNPTGLPCTSAALDRLRQAHPGIIVVAAAGNDSRTEKFFPAALPDVIGVGALDRNFRRASFSNYGGWVDVFTLGEDIESSYVGPDITQLGGGTSALDAGVRWSGTSFAAPRFAGLLAAAMRP